MKKHALLFTMLLALISSIWAQTDTTSSQGNIEMGEVIIEKDQAILLPKATKRYQSAKAEILENGPLNVIIESKEPEMVWPAYVADIPVQKSTRAYPEGTYQNYVKLGFGNYTSPYLESGIYKKIGAFHTATKLMFESFRSGPVGDQNSGNSQGLLDISATYKPKEIKWTPQLYYQHQAYRFYGNTQYLESGFDPERSPWVQYANLGFKLSLQKEKGEFQYFFIPAIQATNQRQSGADINKEMAIGAKAGIQLEIDPTFTAGLKVQGHSAQYESGLTYKRTLVNIHPWIRYAKNKVNVTGGFSLASSKEDTLQQSKIYPDLLAEWQLSKSWQLYGSLQGGVSWQDLASLLSDNEFLDDSLQIRNQETSLSIGGGIKGSLSKKIAVDINLDVAAINHLPFFIPSESDSARFTITYDTETVDRIQLNTIATFMPSTYATYRISMQLNGYSVSALDRPWHMPSLVGKMAATHRIKEKLIFTTDLWVMGGIRAPTTSNFGIVTLKPIYDLNLGLSYLVSDRGSIWLSVENMFGNEYQRYIGYPVRGINFKIGGKYRF